MSEEDSKREQLTPEELAQIRNTANFTRPDVGGRSEAALRGMADLEAHLANKNPPKPEATALARELIDTNASRLDPESN